jgi:pimeloyl-ACP methyl ester carboxylesterase
VDIVFDRRGDGPPLVLLHGIGHRRQAWEPVLDALAKERDVIAVDLPGFGESPPLPAGTPYTIEASLDIMTGMFDRLGLSRPHIAGNSLGGLFALEAADRGLVSSATALSPAGFFNARELAVASVILRAYRRGAALPEGLRGKLAASPALRRAMFGMIYGRADLIDLETLAADARAMRDCPGFEPTLRAGRHTRFRGACADVPVTIAWGTGDRLLRLRQAVRAQRALPNARFVWLEGCGHVPMWDDPDQVARVLLAGSAHPVLDPAP